MSRMKFFDPACGSGNFLIIAYKCLRQLENKILHVLQQCFVQTSIQFTDSSVIKISQFYGIELDDFAHETAILSLWLAEHQMNCLFAKEFGVNIKALPLKINLNIRHGNACRLDWNEVCPHTANEEVFVMGNPSYVGSKVQSKTQKADIAAVFGKLKNSKILDYIANWFYLGAKYIKNSAARYAFVSTNSICQGEQVSVLWPEIFK